MCERWFFRIDSKQYGPVDISRLEALLQPPRLAKMVEVRPESQVGSWLTIGPQDDFSTAIGHFNIELNETRKPETRTRSTQRVPSNLSAVSTTIHDYRILIVDLLLDHRWAVIAIVAWLFANTLLYYFVLNDDSEERAYLQTYAEVWDEFQQMRNGRLNDEQWQAFVVSAQDRLVLTIDQLAYSSGDDEPVRRSLLWAGRDCLLPLVSMPQPTNESNRLERAYLEHIQAAEQALNGHE